MTSKMWIAASPFMSALPRPIFRKSTRASLLATDTEINALPHLWTHGKDFNSNYYNNQISGEKLTFWLLQPPPLPEAGSE